jgi:hypothetical protein
MSTRDQFTAPDEDAPTSTESFRFVIVRPPRQIAAMRAGLRHILRRPGERLWLLLHALSPLDGRGSTAQAIALAEDDYRRLAARQQETRAMRSRHRVAPRHERAPVSQAEAKAPSP